MATYFIGDLQGCYDEFQLLLERVNFDPACDKLYLTGDLIARGDQSLACLRLVKSLGDAAKTVLGNHDLHLLACALGIKKIKPRDRVDQIFNAHDCDQLIDWLRHQPLLIDDSEQDFVLVHAGISPDWDLPTAKACAVEIEEILQNGDYRWLLSNMYDNSPDRWASNLEGIERLRYSINVLTRMRYCYADHRLDFACKLPPTQAPAELKPWFELKNPLFQTTNIIFGHWASLLTSPAPANIYALDRGCVWGNEMRVLRWQDKAYFDQPAIKNYGGCE